MRAPTVNNGFCPFSKVTQVCKEKRPNFRPEYRHPISPAQRKLLPADSGWQGKPQTCASEILSICTCLKHKPPWVFFAVNIVKSLKSRIKINLPQTSGKGHQVLILKATRNWNQLWKGHIFWAACWKSRQPCHGLSLLAKKMDRSALRKGGFSCALILLR